MKKNSILCLFQKIGLDSTVIHRLAVQTGFIKRVRTINAVAFLVFMVTESLRGCVSCNDLAAAIQCESSSLATRQAYHRRMGKAAIRFFEAVLARLMFAKAQAVIPCSFRKFKRILVQDSTIIKLPSKLMETFSGVRNAYEQVCNARIQTAYDLLAGNFVYWAIHSYRQTDIAVAAELTVASGDLILRDRGYFTPNETRRIIQAGGDFVGRYRHKTILRDPQTGDEIDLFRLLKEQGNVDRKVIISQDNPIEVRLVTAEVSQEIANLRRYKAKKENKGHQPSEAVLFLLGYTIFLTSLTSQELSIHDLLGLYGLRWRIETIFKTWKSHFSFDKIHNVGEDQLRLILMARFMAITLFYEKIYFPLEKRVAQTSTKQLSLMKLMKYISRNLTAIPELLKAALGATKNLNVVVKYCTYDKRKRPNSTEKEREILTIMDSIETLS